MTRLAKLKQRSLESANWRKHTMSRFKALGQYHHLSTCIACGAEVLVNLKPQPNEIDVGGEAVAVNCCG
jgi:hypothetical protein